MVSASSPSSTVPPDVRRARVGVILLFFLNGVAWTSIVPRYPEIKSSLELSDTWWGIVIALGPIGGLVAGLATARLMRRFNSAVVASVAQALGILMLNLIANASVAVLFALGLFLMMGFDALCDIAMNSHGLRVQRLYRRSILNSFHAWWSVGAVCGGVIGSVFLQWGIALWLQALITSVVFLAMSLYAHSLLLTGPDPSIDNVTAPTDAPSRIPGSILLRLLALGALGAVAGMIEDIGNSWAAIYMERDFDVIPFVIGMGFVALQGAQVIGRFTGDRLVDSLGTRLAVVQGGVIAGIGMLLAILFPSATMTIIGFACAGWGIATAIPAAMHTADELPGLKAGTGLTIVTWFLRIGFFVGPPIIGAVADAIELRWALMVAPIAALLMVVLSPSLTPKRR